MDPPRYSSGHEFDTRLLSTPQAGVWLPQEEKRRLPLAFQKLTAGFSPEKTNPQATIQ
jgi:hypothetical protein